MKVTAVMFALVAVVTAANKTPGLRSAERELQAEVDLVDSEEELNDDQDDMTLANNTWYVLSKEALRDEDMLRLGDDDAVLYDDEKLGVTLSDDGFAYDDEAYDDDGDYGDDEYEEDEGTRV
jgi:hypothetical protein